MVNTLVKHVFVCIFYVLPGQRLNNFFVRVGNSSDIAQHVMCYYYDGTVGQVANVTIHCNTDMIGQWVSVQRTNGDYSSFLHLCEVQVYAKG